MRVKELLERKGTNVISIAPSTSLGAASRLLLEHKIGGVPVVTADGEVVGFVAEREFVTAVDETNASIRRSSVTRVMQTPAPTCAAEDTLHEVMTRMTHERLRHLVVVEDGRVTGVISVGDLVKYRLEELETETGVLRDYVAGRRAIR